jgi:hypothetical protein
MMPTLRNLIPSYRKHTTGQGVVILNSHDFYLGRLGTSSRIRIVGHDARNPIPCLLYLSRHRGLWGRQPPTRAAGEPCVG